MRDIAKLNHSSVASLYNHFASKDELLLGIAERFFGEYMADLRATAQADGTGLQRLLDIVRLLHRYSQQHYDDFASLFHDARHVAHTDSLVQVLEWRRDCVVMINEVVAQGIADGSIQSDIDPAALVWIISYCTTGLLDQWRTAAFVDPFREDPLATLLSLISEGLRPRATEAGQPT